MAQNILLQQFIREMHAEVRASKRCLERIPVNNFGFKPHPTSMEMRYLALLVAEIPAWITHAIEDGQVEFATYEPERPETPEAFVALLEKNVAAATKAMESITDDNLPEPFALKKNGEVLYTSSKLDTISSTLNHWVHHRGQLTVYMRMNGIEVPSIYGPSADEKQYGLQ
jgi:uncharacterized damage-inducible protein DinB